jgi:multicopper oxidase
VERSVAPWCRESLAGGSSFLAYEHSLQRLAISTQPLNLASRRQAGSGKSCRNVEEEVFFEYFHSGSKVNKDADFNAQERAESAKNIPIPDDRRLARIAPANEAWDDMRTSNQSSVKSRPFRRIALNRRHFIAGAGALAFQAGGRALFPNIVAATEGVAKADFTLRIAPVSVELAPGKTVKTIGYNGTVPGPILRMREGVATTVDVLNDTDAEELVHWHGLMVPAEVDGAAEEGTPPVPAHGRQRYTFIPKPAGTRWYHTHNIAGSDLTRGMYSANSASFM